MGKQTLAALCIAGCASTVSAQGTSLEIVLYCVNGNPNVWDVTAELVNPTDTIRAVVSDLAFTLTGTNLANFEYNPAFDSTFFGPATVTATSTQIDFSGTNTLPPLNNASGPDSSNPLSLFSFTGSPIDFVINGQLSGAYVGSPFDNVFFYQDALGNPGTVPFNISIVHIPAPASLALLGLGGLATARRRR